MHNNILYSRNHETEHLESNKNCQYVDDRVTCVSFSVPSPTLILPKKVRNSYRSLPHKFPHQSSTSTSHELQRFDRQLCIASLNLALLWKDRFISRNVFRRNCLAGDKPAVLLLQTQVCALFPLVPSSKLTFAEPPRRRTSVAMNTMSPVSATVNLALSPTRAMPQYAHIQAPARSTST